MKLRYPFLYLVLASALLAGVLTAVGVVKERPSISAPGLSRDRVALVQVAGVITSSHDVPRGTTSARSIIDQLEKHGKDDSVKAVVLRIDSPGGTVVAAQEVYAALQRMKEEGEKVIVASMADLSASGGYYIACAADRIYANPGTITGSIGVIMQFPNLEGLFGKLGIATTTIKSGRFKDTGSSSRAMTDEERRILQSLLDDVHGQFIEAVQEGRGMTRDQVLPLADGRIFTGRQALELGLVDETGDLQDAIRKAGELSGIKGAPTVLEEKRKVRFWEIFESRFRSLLPFSSGAVSPETGSLLYLWK